MLMSHPGSHPHNSPLTHHQDFLQDRPTHHQDLVRDRRLLLPPFWLLSQGAEGEAEPKQRAEEEAKQRGEAEVEDGAEGEGELEVPPTRSKAAFKHVEYIPSFLKAMDITQFPLSTERRTVYKGRHEKHGMLTENKKHCRTANVLENATQGECYIK